MAYSASIDFPEGVGAPEYPLDEAPEDAVLRAKFEDGTEQTRPKFTRNRYTFTMAWKLMPTEEKELLEEFYNKTTKNGSVMFNWNHPLTGKQYVVRFAEPPTYKLVLKNYYQVSIKVREV